MAIVKMNKFTLFAFESHRENLLKELQKIEAVHFKNLQLVTSEEFEDLSKVYSGENQSFAEAELSKVSFTISKIEPYYEKPTGLKGLTAPSPELDFEEFDSFTKKYDYNAVYNLVKECDERSKLLKAEKNKLKTDNDALGGWLKLDVSTKELDYAKSTKYMLGTLPKQMAESFVESVTHDFPNTYVELLDSVKEEIAVLIITMAEDIEGVSNSAKASGFTKASLSLDKPPSEIVAANNKRASEIEKAEIAAEDEIKAQGVHYENLKIAYDYFKTLSERYKVCENFLQTKNICIAEGWIANDDVGILDAAVKKVCGSDYFIETEPVEKDSEEVPIRLKNNKLVSAFENITEMYSMPKYNEVDPTPLLTPFYLMFFGIMVGDSGYGLVIALGSFLALKFFNLKKGAKKFMQFFFYLGLATMVMGLMFGSAFGVPFFTPLKTPDGSPKAILDSQLDIVIMLVLSIAIGVIQIIFGLGIKGYMLIRDGKVLDAIFDSLFWILAVASLVGLISGAALSASAAMMNIAWVVFIGSILGLAFTQGRSSPSIGGKIGNGIYSVYGITGYVGDFVSYTRLVALALSGSYIAYSFNLMAGLMPGALKYIFGALIAVFGAVLNLALSALGAYVHTCRLQYVEYFGKFYEGGGQVFKPFELQNTFVNIKK